MGNLKDKAITAKPRLMCTNRGKKQLSGTLSGEDAEAIAAALLYYVS